MNTKFERTKPVILLTGIVMVAMGVAVLINPIGAVEALVRIFGLILVAYAVFTIVPAFMRGNPLKNEPANLAIGAIAAIVGLVMAIAPKLLVSAVWTIIGIIVLITGLLDIMEAGTYRSNRSPLAMPATASGVITAILGALVILAPLGSMAVAMLVAAIALLIDGITEIIFALGME